MRWFVVLALLVGPACDQVLGLEPRPTPPCPSQFTEHGHLAIHQAVTYEVAEASCRAIEAPGPEHHVHLIVISDVAETEILARLIGEAWVGLNDRATEGLHRWITDEATGPTPWDLAQGQPNEFPAPQDCAVWLRDGMHDKDCAELHGYVCECDEYPVLLDRI